MEYSVKDTNMDALISKVSAIDLGYFQDQYAQSICKEKQKKDVIIKRGYWARVQAIRQIIEKFSQIDAKKQIISLGAGYDTTYYLFKDQLKDSLYLEIDLEEVIHNKKKLIAKSEIIKKQLNLQDKEEFQTEFYKLISCDITQTEKLHEKLQQNNIDFSNLTLVFSECVLTYIDGDKVDNIIKYFNEKFENVIFVTYEMFNPFDGFGKMMVRNFEVKQLNQKMKGCPLNGIFAYPYEKDQIERYKKFNYNQIQFYDMITFYNKIADQNDRKRIEKIDFLDEVEEWNMIMGHYFILLASKLTQRFNDIKLF